MPVIYFIFPFLFRRVLDLFPFIRYALPSIFSGDIPLRSITQGSPPFVCPLPPPDLVASLPGSADLAILRFYDPSYFRAGNIDCMSYVWQNLILNSSCGEVDLLEVTREGVRVEHFFRPFRGSFKGKAYDSYIPPPVVINNSATCARFFSSSSVTQQYNG